MDRELLIKMRQIQAERGLAKRIAEDDEGRVCPQGALKFALGQEYMDNIQAYMAMIKSLGFAKPSEMYKWVDRPERTLEEVLERMDRAIEAA